MCSLSDGLALRLILKSQVAGIVNGVPIKRIAAVAALAPVAVLVLLAAPRADANTRGCAPAGATVLRSSGAARVYSLGAILDACLGSVRVRLGSLSAGGSGSRIDRYALAAPYVGFDLVQTGVDTTNSTVSMIDLAAGSNPVVSVIAARPLPRPVSFITVTDLAVSRAGIIAWTARRGALGVTASYQLWAATAEYERCPAAGQTPFTHLSFTGRDGTILHWTVGPAGAAGSSAF
jgi:hypothetical protein